MEKRSLWGYSLVLLQVHWGLPDTPKVDRVSCKGSFESAKLSRTHRWLGSQDEGEEGNWAVWMVGQWVGVHAHFHSHNRNEKPLGCRSHKWSCTCTHACTVARLSCGPLLKRPWSTDPWSRLQFLEFFATGCASRDNGRSSLKLQESSNLIAPLCILIIRPMVNEFQIFCLPLKLPPHRTFLAIFVHWMWHRHCKSVTQANQHPAFHIDHCSLVHAPSNHPNS